MVLDYGGSTVCHLSIDFITSTCPTEFFWSQYCCFEPANPFRFNAGTTIVFDIRLSNPKAKDNFSSALSSFRLNLIHCTKPSFNKKVLH